MDIALTFPSPESNERIMMASERKLRPLGLRSEPSRITLTVSSGNSMRGNGLGISVAEGSSGPKKSPQGCMGVGEGGGVRVAVAVGNGVSVGRRGIKGVGDTVASGSAVTTGPLRYGTLGKDALVTLLHPTRPTAKSEINTFLVWPIIEAFNMDWLAIAIMT